MTNDARGGTLGSGCLTIIGALIAVGLIAFLFAQCRGPTSNTPAPSPRRYARDFVKVDAAGSLGGFGSVLILSGQLANSSPLEIKDPKIRCALYGPSGTKTDEVEETLFQVIPAGKTIHFSRLNMGFVRRQSARFGCDVLSATWTKTGTESISEDAWPKA